MKKKIAIGIAALTIGSAIATGALAYNGFEKGVESSVELHDAIESGDYNAFVNELSLIDAKAANRMTEDHFNKIINNYEIRDEIRDAIENNDYNAWVESVSKTPHGEDIAKIISEEDFADLIVIHDAKKAGDFETAKEIQEDLGIKDMQFRRNLKEKQGYGQKQGKWLGKHLLEKRGFNVGTFQKSE